MFVTFPGTHASLHPNTTEVGTFLIRCGWGVHQGDKQVLPVCIPRERHAAGTPGKRGGRACHEGASRIRQHVVNLFSLSRRNKSRSKPKRQTRSPRCSGQRFSTLPVVPGHRRRKLCRLSPPVVAINHTPQSRRPPLNRLPSPWFPLAFTSMCETRKIRRRWLAHRRRLKAHDRDDELRRPAGPRSFRSLTAGGARLVFRTWSPPASEENSAVLRNDPKFLDACVCVTGDARAEHYVGTTYGLQKPVEENE